MNDCPKRRDAAASASATVAQSIAALLRLSLDVPPREQPKRQDRKLASSFELSQLVGDFLKISDPDERRHCLAVLRTSAKASD